MTDVLGGETVAGGQMKTTFGWNNGGNGTNSSGFSGLPIGFRNANGSFGGAGGVGGMWSSSPNGSLAWYRGLDYDLESVQRYSNVREVGFSIRCIKDTE